MSTEEMRCFTMIERLYKAADARVSDLEAECERLRAIMLDLRVNLRECQTMAREHDGSLGTRLLAVCQVIDAALRDDR